MLLEDFVEKLDSLGEIKRHLDELPVLFGEIEDGYEEEVSERKEKEDALDTGLKELHSQIKRVLSAILNTGCLGFERSSEHVYGMNYLHHEMNLVVDGNEFILRDQSCLLAIKYDKCECKDEKNQCFNCRDHKRWVCHEKKCCKIAHGCIPVHGEVFEKNGKYKNLFVEDGKYLVTLSCQEEPIHFNSTAKAKDFAQTLMKEGVCSNYNITKIK